MVLATVRVCQHSLCTSSQHAEPGCDFHRGIVGCAVGFSGFHFFTNMPVLARCKPTITVVSQNGCLFIASLLLTKGLSADVGIWRRPVANVMKCLLLTTCHRRNIGFFWCEAVTWFLCVLGFSPHTWESQQTGLAGNPKKSEWLEMSHYLLSVEYWCFRWASQNTNWKKTSNWLQETTL